MQYEHKNAYRHMDGSVEGFVGRGATKAKAKADAVEQMRRKADILSDAFDKAKIIESPSTLATPEIAVVQRDWKTSVRY